MPPCEIAQIISDSGVAKAAKSAAALFILGILAGVYIAFASEGSTMAAFNLLAKPETFGLGRCLAGAIFPGGLMLVVIAGGELFTGNTMMLLPLCQHRINIFGMLRNWCIVYLGNLAGSLFVAFLIYQSGQLNGGNALLGGMTIKIAAAKCGLTFMEAFSLGILCNWLVCLAVWMAAAAKDVAGKIFAVYFPIWLFITSGFEHSVANMYYISAGLFAAANPVWRESAMTVAKPEMLSALTWSNFFTANLLPVTLGNIVGGGLFVALAYGFACNAFSLKNE
ncbi:MAG: formate/nitrite transporter family protein [Planctomycetaceae bacterium]|jgi:formate/nitrite transporter|nr:formate/nitrite transporter family protein [Planctomycetaceae bacterium]